MIVLQKIARGLLVATLLCALAALFLPTKAIAKPAPQPSCCAHMKATTDAGDECPMHHDAPSKQEQSACCQACAQGLALLFTTLPNFIYASTGEESLVSLNARSHSLPHRPPVPPPRVAFS